MNKKKQRRLRPIKWERRRTVALIDANKRLREELRHTEQECQELRDVCANLVIERDAADGLLREIEVSERR
jgi:hypothetical protein